MNKTLIKEMVHQQTKRNSKEKCKNSLEKRYNVEKDLRFRKIVYKPQKLKCVSYFFPSAN